MTVEQVLWACTLTLVAGVFFAAGCACVRSAFRDGYTEGQDRVYTLTMPLIGSLRDRVGKLQAKLAPFERKRGDKGRFVGRAK